MSIVTSLKRGLQNGCGTMKNEGIPNQILPASCPCKVAGVVLCFHLLYTCSLFVVATKEQTKCFTRGHQQNSWMRCWCKTKFSLRNFCVACDFSTFARSWSQILDKRQRQTSFFLVFQRCLPNASSPFGVTAFSYTTNTPSINSGKGALFHILFSHLVFVLSVVGRDDKIRIPHSQQIFKQVINF